MSVVGVCVCVKRSHLAAIEADAQDLVLVLRSLGQGCLGIFLRQMSKEAHDECTLELEPRALLAQRTVEAVDDRGEGHTPSSVALWVEEDLCVSDVVGRGTANIGRHEIVEVLLGL